MTLDDAIRRRTPLAIEADGYDLFMAEAFLHPDGLLWLEAGWQVPGWHPGHMVPGEFKSTGDTAWSNGTHTIYQTAPGLPTWEQYQLWKRYLTTKGGDKEATRDKARAYLQLFFELDGKDMQP